MRRFRGYRSDSCSKRSSTILEAKDTARTRPDKYPWVTELLGRRPAKVVAVALANKMARTAWAVLAKGETYRAPARSSSAAIVAAA